MNLDRYYGKLSNSVSAEMNPARSVSDKNFVGLPRFAVWEKSVSRFKLMIILKFKYQKTIRPLKLFNRFRYWFV